MSYSVEVQTVLSDGAVEGAYRTLVTSIGAALRVADCNTPAPLNPSVRARIRRNLGGCAQVGQVRVAIDCAA
jgi:hypothetical protein